MLIQRLIPRSTPLLAVSFFKQHSTPVIRIRSTPFLTSPNPFSFFTSLSSRPPLFSCSLYTSRALLELPDSVVSEAENGDEVESEGADFDAIDTEEGLEEVLEANSKAATGRESKRELPSLTVKEKKELASYAHSLGKKLKSQQIGKSGVTETVIMALIETLEKNELLKVYLIDTNLSDSPQFCNNWIQSQPHKYIDIPGN